MQWQEVRRHFLQQWVLIESLQAHSEGVKRILDQVIVINSYRTSSDAMQAYQQLHQVSPNREMYVLHTSQEQIHITERHWVGIRGAE